MINLCILQMNPDIQVERNLLTPKNMDCVIFCDPLHLSNVIDIIEKLLYLLLDIGEYSNL